MKLVDVNNLKFTENPVENVLLGFLDKTRNYDVVLARVKPGETPNPHKHKRSNNGDEVFLFHKGGV